MIDTKEDIEIYQRILFQPCDIDAEIEGLTLDQKKSLAIHLAQKIAFEAVPVPPYRSIKSLSNKMKFQYQRTITTLRASSPIFAAVSTPSKLVIIQALPEHIQHNNFDVFE